MDLRSSILQNVILTKILTMLLAFLLFLNTKNKKFFMFQLIGMAQGVPLSCACSAVVSHTNTSFNIRPIGVISHTAAKKKQNKKNK